jgi:hypothetical protein
MHGRALVLALLMLCSPARGDSIAFQIWPSRNSQDLVTCRIELRGGQIVAIEYRGSGAPPALIMRWPVRRAEEIAILHVLQALISGDLPGVDPYSSRVPLPPYVMVTWSSRVNDRLVTGMYLQKGLDLPPILAGLIDTILPGGPCETETTAPFDAPD